MMIVRMKTRTANYSLRDPDSKNLFTPLTANNYPDICTICRKQEEQYSLSDLPIAALHWIQQCFFSLTTLTYL